MLVFSILLGFSAVEGVVFLGLGSYLISTVGSASQLQKSPKPVKIALEDMGFGSQDLILPGALLLITGLILLIRAVLMLLSLFLKIPLPLADDTTTTLLGQYGVGGAAARAPARSEQPIQGGAGSTAPPPATSQAPTSEPYDAGEEQASDFFDPAGRYRAPGEEGSEAGQSYAVVDVPRRLEQVSGSDGGGSTEEEEEEEEKGGRAAPAPAAPVLAYRTGTSRPDGGGGGGGGGGGCGGGEETSVYRTVDSTAGPPAATGWATADCLEVHPLILHKADNNNPEDEEVKVTMRMKPCTLPASSPSGRA